MDKQLKTFRIPFRSQSFIDIDAVDVNEALTIFANMNAEPLWEALHDEGIFALDDDVETYE